MSDTGPTLGFIGLGVMGEPICRNLARKSGLPVQAFDPQIEPLQRLAAAGVGHAHSVPAVLAAADLVFLSLPSGEVVARVAEGDEGTGGLVSCAREDQVFIDLGTTSVETTRMLGEAMARKGAIWVDAPVARTRAAAEAGTLSVMVGAAPALFERIRPLIATFASDISLCGGIGCGQIVKILNNMVLFETVAALGEALAIGRRAGMDPDLLFETLTKGSADSFALRNHGIKAMLPDDCPERAFSVRYARKDLTYALKLARSTGVDARGAQVVDQWFQAAIDAGLGDLYHPVIGRVIAAAGAGQPSDPQDPTPRPRA